MYELDHELNLPDWACKESRPMQQAIAMLLSLLECAPGVALQVGALHRPAMPDEQLEIMGSIPRPDPELTLELLRRARGANVNPTRQANVLVRPDPSAAHPWLFVDDLPRVRARSLSDAFAAIVIETSRDNAQVRLLADRCITMDLRTAAQRELQQRLQSDEGSIAGDKWGRLAGFTNRKASKFGQWTNLIVDSTRSRPPIPADALLSLSSALAVTLAPQGGRTTDPPSRPRPIVVAGAVSSKTKAEWAREALSRPLPDASEGAAGYRQEFADCCQALRAQLPYEEIIDAIAARALERGKRRNDRQALRYAVNLLRAAQRALG